MALGDKKILKGSTLMIFGYFLLCSNALGYPTDQYGPPDDKIKIPYSFSYGVQDDYQGTNFKRMEESDGDLVVGSYSVQLPDGRTQNVKYKADSAEGFIADVSYYGEASYPPPSQDPPFIVNLQKSYEPSQPLSHMRDVPSQYQKQKEQISEPMYMEQTPIKTEEIRNKVIKMKPIYLRTVQSDQGSHGSTAYDSVYVPEASDLSNINTGILREEHEERSFLNTEPDGDIAYSQPRRTQHIYHDLPQYTDEKRPSNSLPASQDNYQVADFKLFSFTGENQADQRFQKSGKTKKKSNFPRANIKTKRKQSKVAINDPNPFEEQTKKTENLLHDSQPRVTEASTNDLKVESYKQSSLPETFKNDDSEEFVSHNIKNDENNLSTAIQDGRSEGNSLQQMVSENQHMLTNDPYNDSNLNKPEINVPTISNLQNLKKKSSKKDLNSQYREKTESQHVNSEAKAVSEPTP